MVTFLLDKVLGETPKSKERVVPNSEWKVESL